MVAIKLSAIVGEDRQLNIKLPDDIPAGPIELVIRPAVNQSADPNSPREIARAELMAAGILATPERLGIPTNITPLPLSERLRIGKMPPNARPSEQLIDEDRGDW